MLTLSTDLERRGITDMAAVLWQGTEAAAPVRSSGQTAVVNVEAQREDLLPPCTGSIFFYFTLLYFTFFTLNQPCSATGSLHPHPSYRPPKGRNLSQIHLTFYGFHN